MYTENGLFFGLEFMSGKKFITLYIKTGIRKNYKNLKEIYLIKCLIFGLVLMNVYFIGIVHEMLKVLIGFPAIT